MRKIFFIVLNVYIFVFDDLVYTVENMNGNTSAGRRIVCNDNDDTFCGRVTRSCIIEVVTIRILSSNYRCRNTTMADRFDDRCIIVFGVFVRCIGRQRALVKIASPVLLCRTRRRKKWYNDPSASTFAPRRNTRRVGTRIAPAVNGKP
jgi:hypothetical protein